MEEFYNDLTKICNPEAVNMRAKREQQAKIDIHGGKKIQERGDFGYSPAPGQKQNLIKMLTEEKKNTNQKNEHFKDVIIAILVLTMKHRCFFTFNPAGAPLTVGTDGMTFATYPLGVATLLTVLGLIYLVISLKKYFNAQENYNVIDHMKKALINKQILYLKRLVL